jgi:sugar phosphate isomerase/epimerase
MSFAVLENKPPDQQMVGERIRRLHELYKMFTDAGIMPVHENCMNYGGMGWEYTLRLLENIHGLKLVFDTGNPIFSNDYTKPKPYPRQSTWEFYEHVKKHIAYVHIKDGVWDTIENKPKFSFAGEDDGDVKQVVKDLLDNGDDGGISIEPHLAIVFHDNTVKSEEKIKYDSYVEYGRRFMKLLKDIGDPVKP